MIKWTVVFVFLNLLAFGQDVSIDPAKNPPVTLSEEFRVLYPLQDNQYISNHWAKGKLFYSNGSSNAYDSLNFDRYSGYMEAVINSKPLSLLPMGFAGAVIYNSPNAGYVIFSGVIENEKRFLIVYSAGKFILAAHTVVVETITTSAVNLDEVRFEAKPKSEINIERQYYLWKEGNWEPFKLSKSGIMKLFSVDKKDIQSFMGQNNINSNQEDGYVKVFEHFNRDAH